MKLLAIDTSSDACSVALQAGEFVREEHVVRPREHTRLLMPMIRNLLSGAGIEPPQLDALVLGNGPGSFIGMRIAAAAAQGIALAADIEIAPVSSLAAIALEVGAEYETRQVVVAQDARMGEIYLGEYEIERGALPSLLAPERICSVGELELSGETPVAAGAAWQRYPELRARNEDRLAVVTTIERPARIAPAAIRTGASRIRSDNSTGQSRSRLPAQQGRCSSMKMYFL